MTNQEVIHEGKPFYPYQDCHEAYKLWNISKYPQTSVLHCIKVPSNFKRSTWEWWYNQICHMQQAVWKKKHSQIPTLLVLCHLRVRECWCLRVLLCNKVMSHAMHASSSTMASANWWTLVHNFLYHNMQIL